MDLIMRPRRLRSSETLRRLVRETRVSADSLVYPIFVTDGENKVEEIEAMPGQYRYTVDRLGKFLCSLYADGVHAVMLFGIPAVKDEQASQAYAPDGVVQRALREGRRCCPEMYYITDVCLCEYMSHGHCGIICGEEVLNDESVELLARTALSHAQAGADMVAPSDMMDGRVGAIREKLDENGFLNVPIMAYSAKYASAFYGPFREAAGSAPAFGDRKSYQMDFHNAREGLKEIETDLAEGADIVMVKPALSYLDIVAKAAELVDVPVAAYSVSGEYAMVKAAAQKGWIDEERIVAEMAVSAFRAGVNIYITYYARELARMIREGKIG
ncbi:MAG: porphobilinogen synthase [Oscillospiraceae bacterium]|nr:porphobilinogen synthase [Oscillospiraceae bacterium]